MEDEDDRLEKKASMEIEVMPEISRFFGIIIAMFYDDHNPPHFHARYGEYKAAIRVEDFAVL